MPSVLDAFVRFLGDTKDLEKSLGPNGPVAVAANKGGTAAGNTLGTKIGTGVAKGFTAAGAAGGLLFTSAVESGVKFEDQLRTINTVAGLSDEKLFAVGDGIQALSRETGKTTDDLTAGYYDLVSAGVSVDDALSVLRDSAILGTGALGSTGEAVDLLTSTLNAYGLEASDSARVSDIFAKAVADGKVTAAELGNSIANIAPVASAAGISLEEVSSGFAFLTAKGTPAAQAATQMRAAISALLTPNEQLNKIQEQTGINFAELAKEKGLAVALDTLRTATEGNATALDKLAGVSAEDFPKALKTMQDELGLTNSDVEKFSALAGKDGAAAALNDLVKQVGEGDSGFAKALGSIEGYQFALNTTGDAAGAFADQIVETTNATGTALSQYEEKSKSAAEQGKRLSASVTTFLQDLGGPFVQTLGPAIGALGQLTFGIGSMIPTAKIAGTAIGGLAGKMAAGLTGLGIKLLPALTGFVPMIAGGLASAGSAIGGLIAAAIPVGMALLPVILLAALVAAVVFLINNPDIVSKIAEVAGSIISSIGEFLTGLAGTLLNAFTTAFNAVLAAAPGFILSVVGLILSIPFRIADLGVSMLEFFASVWTNILGGVAQLIANIVGFFFKLPGRVAQFGPRIIAQFVEMNLKAAANVAGLIGKVVGFFLSLPGKVAAMVPGVLANFVSLAGRVVTTVTTLVGRVVEFFMSIPGKIADLGGKIVSGIINGMAGLPGKLLDTVANAFRSIKIDIGPFHIDSSGVRVDLPKIELPSFAVGTPKVPFDMTAQIHAGEMIVPAQEAEAIRQGRASLGVQQEVTSNGGDVTVNVSMEAAPAARDPMEVARQLRRLADFGVLSPARTME